MSKYYSLIKLYITKLLLCLKFTYIPSSVQNRFGIKQNILYGYGSMLIKKFVSRP